MGKNRGLGAGVKVRGKIIVDKRGMGGGRGKNKRWQVKVGWSRRKSGKVHNIAYYYAIKKGEGKGIN